MCISISIKSHSLKYIIMNICGNKNIVYIYVLSYAAIENTLTTQKIQKTFWSFDYRTINLDIFGPGLRFEKLSP